MGLDCCHDGILVDWSLVIVILGNGDVVTMQRAVREALHVMKCSLVVREDATGLEKAGIDRGL